MSSECEAASVVGWRPAVCCRTSGCMRLLGRLVVRLVAIRWLLLLLGERRGCLLWLAFVRLG